MEFPVLRFGTILAVSDVDRSVAFYSKLLGFEVEALYADPPYATLKMGRMRLSLAEQGHASPDRPDVGMAVPDDRSRIPVVIVLEVGDAKWIYDQLASQGAELLAEPYAPPWGGLRFFVADPDGYLVEIEQLASGGRA
jgi:catechol 2,3-dioxygenase-like lactoylglutathione lyase family enzyme